MSFKRKKRKMLDQDAVPTTSLADMMFLLLMFFIMTHTFSRVTGLVSKIPAGQQAQQQQSEKSTTISLTGTQILVNDKNMGYEDAERLVRGLGLAEKAGDAKIVVLNAGKDVPYQLYYRTMAMIQASGGVIAIEVADEEEAKAK